jgi:hypothetical protein
MGPARVERPRRGSKKVVIATSNRRVAVFKKGWPQNLKPEGVHHADFSAGRSSAKLAGRHHARLRFAGRERPLASHADIRVFYPTPADGTGAAFEPGWELRS